MTQKAKSLAIEASSVPPRKKRSNYPAPFSDRVAGREKRVLGEVFGLRNFGVNLTRLAPGAQSALLHRHSKQDEFVYILEGQPTLVTSVGERTLGPGMCAGFAAGGISHHLVNRSERDVLFLEVGDRSRGDAPEYPDDDIKAELDADGNWVFLRKDGRPY